METHEEITVKQIESKIKYAFDLQDSYKEAKRIAEELFAKLKDFQEQIVTDLESLKKTQYKSDSGLFMYRYASSYQTPKTPEDKELFYGYLKNKGLFENMISVNSRTLNSWAKQEEESNADILDFQIPGLKKGDPEPIISMRRN